MIDFAAYTYPHQPVPCNFHTHSLYCDGKNSLREMIEQARALGCAAIGFSGHSYTPFDESYCMSKAHTEEYKAELRSLKKEYAGKIQIFMGIEQDIFSTEPTDDYDYIIGSVHYVLAKGDYLPIDESAAKFCSFTKDYFDGDYLAFAEAYYALEAQVYEKTHCDIIGHFDLITKFNEGDKLFSTTDPRYVHAADAALNQLLSCPATFEINTGAISRGYRTTPYPAPRILTRLQQCGKKIMWNSDCHNKKDLLLMMPGAPVTK